MRTSLPRLCGFAAFAMTASLAAQAQGPIFSTFGAGCSGTMPPAEFTLTGSPVAGTNLQFELNNLPDNAALLIFGFSNTTSIFGPLPGPIGNTPGCMLHISPDITRFYLTSGNVLSYSKSLPSGTGVLGTRIFFQALVFDSGHTPDGFVMSDALETEVGTTGWPAAHTVANMQPVAPGSFTMGSNTAFYAYERPAHAVNLTDPYWIGRYEVTQAEYEAVMGNNPSFHQGGSYGNTDDRPVENVSWTDAMQYCAELTDRERAAGRLPAGYVYRLPTEAEWEYACRSGSGTAWYFGNQGSLNCGLVNTSNCVGQTREAGTYPANAWNLHEMHGNVGEWCLDRWDSSANYPSTAVTDPYVTVGADRVYRGGSFNISLPLSKSYTRLRQPPTTTRSDIGFRIALAPAKVLETMVPLPNGAFSIGSNTAFYVEERPAHTVNLTDTYWIGRYEVTQAEYLALMGNNPSFHQSGNTSNRPVENVSWHDAMAYCAALTAQEAAAGRLPDGYEYRLPTEAEWEIACRSGTGTAWFFGNQASVNCGLVNHSNCVQGTRDVGYYPPNAWGIHEMHGNVREWCLDSWDGSANYPSGAITDPFVVEGTDRVNRGGGWLSQLPFTKSHTRSRQDPSTTRSDTGFRVALAPIALGVANMTRIQPGTFQMGSTQGDPDEQPVHSVTISEPFWMGQFEVTQAEYQAVMGTNPSSVIGADLPVDSINWNLAMGYCAAVNAREARAGRLPDGYEYRLPTEAEWEYCCRAGTTTEWITGTSLNATQANISGGAGPGQPVGSYAPNPWGLYDMHGNVEEIVLDGYDGNNYPSGPVTDPYVLDGIGMIVRGGSYGANSYSARSAERNARSFWSTFFATGFRIVLAPKQGVDGMVRVQSGVFDMGSAAVGGAAVPVHGVSILQPFWIGQHEVTQADYEALMGTNPSFHQGASFPGDAKRPVEQVNWHGALAYCEALTAQEAAAGRLPDGYVYRLPTEAEWEYGCRAGTTTEWSTGVALNSSQANFGNNTGETTTVGSYPANLWGLFDMHGNVFEWCFDSWDLSHNYPAGPVSNPYVTIGANRIYRGGSYYANPDLCRSASRQSIHPATSDYGLGFRVVLAPPLFNDGGAQAGTVDATGQPGHGMGFTSEKSGTGRYRVTLALAFSERPVVIATILGNEDNAISVDVLGGNVFEVYCYDVSPTTNLNAQDSSFSFVAVPPGAEDPPFVAAESGEVAASGTSAASNFQSLRTSEGRYRLNQFSSSTHGMVTLATVSGNEDNTIATIPDPVFASEYEFQSYDVHPDIDEYEQDAGFMFVHDTHSTRFWGVPKVSGVVDTSGAIISPPFPTGPFGQQFTCQHVGTGHYRITLDPVLSGTPVMVASIYSDQDNVISVEPISATVFDVYSRDVDPDNNFVSEDCRFGFIAVSLE